MKHLNLILILNFAGMLCVAENAVDGDSGAFFQAPDAAHAHATRTHEGIPSIAVSARNGRMWCTWYASPTGGEDSNNYVILATSADDGHTWKEALVADPDGGGPVRAFDPEVWIAPDGRLRWTWSERVAPLAAASKDKYAGAGASPKNDRLMMVALDAEHEPQANALPKPRQVARGVMMCKPTVLKDGTWLLPVSHWYEAPSACVVASTDGGKTFVERGGVTLPKEMRLFDEHMIVERRDGSLRCYARTSKGPTGLWEADSTDQGRTWSAPRPSALQHTSSRAFVRRLASGNLLLVKNGRRGKDEGRRFMTAYLSEDDGRTWPYEFNFDGDRPSAYPDGQQLPDGRIVITYDNDRTGRREVLLSIFREEDVKAGKAVSPDARLHAYVTHR